MSFKPLLAAAVEDLSALKFPLLASPKIDGIRCVIRDGKALTRSLKPVPNKHIRDYLEARAGWLEGCDGELLAGETFQETTSNVMSHDTVPAVFLFLVFDNTMSSQGFTARMQTLRDSVCEQVEADPHVDWVPQFIMETPEHVLDYETKCLEQGFEGVMLRAPHATYKHGRSTLKEGILMKLKRFIDAEAVIVGFEEKMHNANEAFTDELGRMKRSSAQEGKVPMGVLGAFILRHVKQEQCGFCMGGRRMNGSQSHWAPCGVCLDSLEFNVGAGMTDIQRADFWDRRAQLLGQLVKYKSLPIGVKEAPRHPVFLGLRDRRDL